MTHRNKHKSLNVAKSKVDGGGVKDGFVTEKKMEEKETGNKVTEKVVEQTKEKPTKDQCFKRTYRRPENLMIGFQVNEVDYFATNCIR